MIGGGAALGVGLGGLGAFVFTRTPSAALAPWEDAGSEAYADDPRLFALSYAILSPSPHNMQPWRVVLEPDESMTLYCDLDRRLPATDPQDRQTTIGLGCFLEMARIAAAEKGYRMDIVPFPDGQPEPNLDARPIATVTMTEDPAVTPSPLFVRVLYRRSNREPCDIHRQVHDLALADLASRAENRAWVHTTHDIDLREKLRELTWQAFKTELATPKAWRETVDVMRIGKSQIDANPDGIALSGASIEVMKTLGILTREELLDPESEAFKEGEAIYEPVIKTAMAYVWQITPDNSRASQLAAGRDWLRMNLESAAIGMAMQPLSQALQEYPEMAAHRAAMNSLLQVPEGSRLQMLGRLGYSPSQPPSPRWPLGHALEEQAT
ncbi:MAG: nitroreductase family protein [Rhodospirillales bacterium]